MPKGWSNKTLQLMASISFFFHESRLRGMFFITINEIKIQITKYITKYITNHNTNRDLEMKIRTFTEIASYVSVSKNLSDNLQNPKGLNIGILTAIFGSINVSKFSLQARNG